MDSEERREDGLVVDAYGVRVKAPRGHLGEPAPQSWIEVRQQLKGHLLRLATAPTRLVVEVIEGLTKLVRGVSSVPSALATRISRGHAVADELEGRRLGNDPVSAATALHSVEQILRRLRVKGYCAEILVRKDGRPAIIVAAPDERELANLLAESALDDSDSVTEMNATQSD